VYIGFAFEREACRTCKGATTVPASGGRIESITIGGVEFAPNPTDLEISEMSRGVVRGWRFNSQLGANLSRVKKFQSERTEAAGFLDPATGEALAKWRRNHPGPHRGGDVVIERDESLVRPAAPGRGPACNGFDTRKGACRCTLERNHPGPHRGGDVVIERDESLMRPAAPGRGRVTSTPPRFDVALTPHDTHSVEVVDRSTGDALEVKVARAGGPDEYGPWQVWRHYPEQGSEGETWEELKRCDWPLDAVQAAVAFYTEYRVRRAFG
jgi:hypothetical protein